MTLRQISVSTVAFDGYPIDTAFNGIAKTGITIVEPAYIKGYMDFDETDFSDMSAKAMSKRLTQHGLAAVAISAHMDSGNPDATEMLARRIRFAAGIGAKYIITNSTTVQRKVALEQVLAVNLPLAENLGVVIALENPGNGTTNLMRDGRSGAAVVREFKSRWLRMNYDTANALTCTEGDVHPERDIEHALPLASHIHLKDVVRYDGGWHYVAIGAGEIDYPVLLPKLKDRSDLPLTIELPLRLKRLFHQDPERKAELPSLAQIDKTIRQSWNTIARAFGDMREI
jgi:sugar phosphate isomerase/epimerase